MSMYFLCFFFRDHIAGKSVAVIIIIIFFSSGMVPTSPPLTALVRVCSPFNQQLHADACSC